LRWGPPEPSYFRIGFGDPDRGTGGSVVAITAVYWTTHPHEITDDDIRHALAHPAYVGDDPGAVDEDTGMTLVLGPDHAAHRLELAALVADDGTVIVVHAMPMRSKYAHLWTGERRSRR